MTDHHGPRHVAERRTLGAAWTRFAAVAGGVGLALLATGLVLGFAAGDGLKQFQHAYLLAFCYVLSLALGGLFFVAVSHLAAAGWSVVVRRLAEIVGAATGPLVLLFLPILLTILFGGSSLYLWNDEEYVATSAILQGKAPYLNRWFFLVRCLVYFAAWGGLSYCFLQWSRSQDESGDKDLTRRMQRLSAPAILLFAGTVTFASFDWLMSLDPYWFSTIFGVYFFAGCAVGFLATLILLVNVLQARGLLGESITVEHRHDLGKLLFGFVFFWGYIAFSQYLLYWYANIPEETAWYLRRQQNGWQYVGLALLFGHLLAPFLFLMPRNIRRHRLLLSVGAVALLVMHWIDLYWLVMPEIEVDAAASGAAWALAAATNLLTTVGMLGLFAATLAWIAADRPLLPVRDPRLEESLSFKNS